MKTTNLNIRLTQRQKKLLQCIASHKKLSMTDLIIAFIYTEGSKPSFICSSKGEEYYVNN